MGRIILITEYFGSCSIWEGFGEKDKAEQA